MVTFTTKVTQMGPGCTSEPEADPLSTKTEVSTHPCHSKNRPHGKGAARRGGRSPSGINVGQTSGRRPHTNGLLEPLLQAIPEVLHTRRRTRSEDG